MATALRAIVDVVPEAQLSDPVLLPSAIGVTWGFLLFLTLFREALTAPVRGRRGRSPSPVVAVLLGLSLVTVPTIFTVFPSTVRWSLGVRVLVVGAWVDLTGIGLSLTAAAELRRYSEERRARRRSEARREMAEVFQRLLVPRFGGMPRGYQFTVYAPDPSDRFMFPLHPRAPTFQDPTIFPIGVGATGAAWERQAVVAVRGDNVANGAYDLTDDQQVYYARFRVVAAAVIHSGDGAPQGVLSAIAIRDDGFFANEDGAKTLQRAADTLGWTMPEAIRWLLPTAEELDP